jgi:hypothetical protein
MVTRSPQTKGGRCLAGVLAVACSACAGNGAGARDPHDADWTVPMGVPVGVSTGAPPRHDGRATRRTLGWVTLAVGAEAAVAAIVTSGMLVHQKSVLDAQCNAQKQCSSAGVDAAGAISTLTPWNTGTWIMTAVGLGAGTALLLTSRPDAPASTAITLTPEGSGAGLGLRGRF